jgi:hypothetical protein
MSDDRNSMPAPMIVRANSAQPDAQHWAIAIAPMHLQSPSLSSTSTAPDLPFAWFG